MCRERRELCCSHVRTERHDDRRSMINDQSLPQNHLDPFRPSGSLPTHKMALQQYGSSSKLSHLEGTTEFEILKSSHLYGLRRCTPLDVLTWFYRFLRVDDEGAKDLSWNDKVAKKYYDSLYKEFAVCDLKHYKSGNVRQPRLLEKCVTASQRN